MIDFDQKLVRDPMGREETPPEAPERPAAAPGGTSEKGKSFKKHCLRCRKFSEGGSVPYHKHFPATYNTPCEYPGCKCSYFFGWENWSKKFKKPLKEIDRDRAEKIERFEKMKDAASIE